MNQWEILIFYPVALAVFSDAAEFVRRFLTTLPTEEEIPYVIVGAVSLVSMPSTLRKLLEKPKRKERTERTWVELPVIDLLVVNESALRYQKLNRFVPVHPAVERPLENPVSAS